MRQLLTLGLFFLCFGSLFAQQPEQDCFNALPVCQSVFTQANSYVGTGNVLNEINSTASCLLSGEKNDVWYIFTVQTSGNLNFSITPNNLADDYDWSVFDLTNNQCADIFNNASLEIGCNYSGNPGITGPNGLAGAQNNPVIPVTAGQTLVLNVSNFSSTQSGYTLDFTQSTAAIFDNIPPTMSVANTPCSTLPALSYNIQFSENVTCASVQASDFTISDPNGVLIPIISVSSAACANGAAFSNAYTLNLASLPTQAGLYTISLVGQVNDNCGNVAAPASQTFVIPMTGLEIIASDTFSCGGKPISLSTNFPSFLEPAAYQWSPVNSQADSLYIIPTTNSTYSVTITDVNGCVYTASQKITQIPAPIFDFTLDKTSICGNNYVTLNPIFTFVPTGNVPYWEFANPALLSIVNGTDDYLINWGTPGTKTIALFFKNLEYNCFSDTVAKTVEVLPVPKNNFDEKNICLYDTTNYIDLTTISSGSIASYNWNPEGNVSVTTKDLNYQFSTPGIKNITLITTSDLGCRDTLTKTIEVYPAPDMPVVDVAPICPNKRAILYATSSPYNTLYWYSDIDATSLVYQGNTFETDSLKNSTTFYVIAEEQTHLCKSLPEPIPVVVFPQQQLSIGAPAQAEIPNAQVPFSAFGSLVNNSYLWDFGDGTFSVESNPTHNYTVPGRYNVILNTIDVNGCETRAIRPIEILQVITVSVPSAFSPNGDLYNNFLTIGFENVREFEFHVFDRWGRSVFESKDFGVQWDGRDKKGKDLPEGVYPYTIKALGVDGNMVERAGTITILR